MRLAPALLLMTALCAAAGPAFRAGRHGAAAAVARLGLAELGGAAGGGACASAWHSLDSEADELR